MESGDQARMKGSSAQRMLRMAELEDTSSSYFHLLILHNSLSFLCTYIHFHYNFVCAACAHIHTQLGEVVLFCHVGSGD